jgi:CHAT domain-containing protein
MKGVSSPVGGVDRSLYFPIVLDGDKIALSYLRFDRVSNDDQLRLQAEAALDAFDRVALTMLRRGGIDLAQDQCESALDELAKWGSRAYKELFSADAKQVLREYLTDAPPDQPADRPTFVSRDVLFPWELLYDGGKISEGGASKFWGFGMAPARILDTQRDNFVHHPGEQSTPSDMLFCLHHLLREAHETEWPAIEKIVLASADDHFSLLRDVGSPEAGLAMGLAAVCDGESLLRYIEASSHNMLHFACHCRQAQGGSDELEISVVGQHAADVTRIIRLETYTFTDLSGSTFVRRPLVFLNACQASGGSDNVRKIFNLPKKFYSCGAGAVIATACPIPDRFAAAFARQFYKFFLGEPGLCIAEALRRTRWHFLTEHNNPLGLAYGLYTPAHYRIAGAPALSGRPA